MQRSTSFFWVSDDLRNNDNDEEEHEHEQQLYDFDEEETDETDEEIMNGIAIPSGNVRHLSIQEESDHDSESLSLEEVLASHRNSHGHEVVSPERIALNHNQSLNNGYYGSSSMSTPAGAVYDNNNNNGPTPATASSSVSSAISVTNPTNGTRRRKLFDLSPSNNNIMGKDYGHLKSIRFQVVIWHLGTIDVQTGHIKMRFRLTLFWNDDKDDSTTTTGGRISPSKTKYPTHSDDVWVMEGRQRAYRRTWNINQQESTVKEMIDVPPVSILNAVEFDTVGDGPEITMTNTQTRSLRWTCMYNATLFQGDHMSVKDFPHDRHEIKLKVGILAHRGKGGRWDHNLYELALAGEHDSQGSTRVPHGLVVGHCHVPDFGFDPLDLRFQFIPLMFGGWKHTASTRADDNKQDVYLQVTLPVYRQSGHYDTSILPTLIMLNIIAITCLPRNFASATAATEIMLSIAFVQVGIRLTLDSRLPSVGYQIKIQKVMNCCFWLLSGLVLESNTMFFLVKKRGWEIHATDKIDLMTACVAMVYNIYIIMTYFRGKGSSGPIM